MFAGRKEAFSELRIWLSACLTRLGKELGVKLPKLAMDLACKELENSCAKHRQAVVGRDCWSRMPDPPVLAGPVPSATKVTVLYHRQHLPLDLAMLL